MKGPAHERCSADVPPARRCEFPWGRVGRLMILALVVPALVGCTSESLRKHGVEVDG